MPVERLAFHICRNIDFNWVMKHETLLFFSLPSRRPCRTGNRIRCTPVAGGDNRGCGVNGLHKRIQWSLGIIYGT